jgi:hypothetical protein
VIGETHVDEPYIEKQTSGQWLLVRSWDEKPWGRLPLDYIDITELVPAFKSQILNSETYISALSKMLVTTYFQGVKHWETAIAGVVEAMVKSDPTDTEVLEMKMVLDEILSQVGPLIESQRPMIEATTEKNVRDTLKKETTNG